jgi:hypothetical protein
MTDHKIPDPKKITDPDKVLVMMQNAKRLKKKEFWQECFEHYCELKAAKVDTDSALVKSYFKFFYAYEQALTEKNSKRTSAMRLKRLVTDRTDKNKGNAEMGIIAALSELVMKKGASSGYQFLMSSGQSELTAEHLVKSNPQHFSKEAITAAAEKLILWEASMADADIQKLIKVWD